MCVVGGSDDNFMGDEEDDDGVDGNDVGVGVGDGDAPHGLRFFRILYRGNGSFSRVAIMVLLLLYHCFRLCHVLFLSFVTVVSRLRSVFGR